jgi:amidase
MRYRPLVGFVVMSSLALAACSKQEPAKPYAVEEVPLAKVSADLAAKHTTSVAVTKAYIDRIKMYDGQLHAVILAAPDALQQAAASDKRRAEGKALGPLDGVPILLKDNIDAVGMPTTAGSYALAENLPLKDSEVVKRLRAAGAVILGKANLSQWAGRRTRESFNGSTVGGTPHNPYDLARSPAGSSSGPGIATAVSFAAASVGSDTTGSIIGPSSMNGIVGMRPTYALVSRRGIVPITETQDAAGPMARSVEDAAMLLTVMAGSDPGDPASADADAHKTDYVKGLNAGALKGVKLGVIRGYGGYSEKTQPAFDASLEVLKAQGAELVDVPGDVLENVGEEGSRTEDFNFKVNLNAYLAGTPPAVKTRTMADLIAFNKSEEHEKLHAQELFESAEATTGGLENPEYIQAREYVKRKTGPEGLAKALSQYGVSALVVLTRGPAPLIVPDGPRQPGEGRREKGPPSASQIAAIAGYPDLNVPMGVVDGLPVGLSFLGAPWSEQNLLSYGYAYEQAAHVRVPPEAYKKAVLDK